MNPKKELTKAQVEKVVLRMLSQARREPRFRAQRERVALIDAIRYGHLQTAQSLLAHDVDPNATESKGRSALWYAAYWGRSELIRDLVARGARVPDDVLMGPVHDGDADSVRLLIRRGANVNCVATFTRYSYKFPRKQVLLTVAMERVRESQILRRSAQTSGAELSAEQRRALPLEPPSREMEAIPLMLIKAGAKVNRLAFDYALYDGYIRSTLGLTAHFGHVRTIKGMLAAGADVNFKDTWGGTALIDAAREGNSAVVRVLLRAGANPETRRRDGLTASSAARQHGCPDLAEEIERYAKAA